MKKIIFSLVLCYLCTTVINVHAQEDICGQATVLTLAEKHDPNLRAKMQSMEAQLQHYLHNLADQKDNEEIITIPVVFHIVYNNDAQNIDDTYLYSQLEVLNEDFRRLNTDTVNTPEYFNNISSDAKIEFCLATRDPNGNPTTGITRTETTVTAFPSASSSTSYEELTRVHYDEKGGKTAWDTKRYLNVWICNFQSSSTIAYAYLPGADPNVDGIVCRYQYMGRPSLNGEPYHLGRTMTHEVGHWLNLYHVFNGGDAQQCSDDFVEDTPTQATQNFGCPDFPYSTCDNYSDMYMNYMDYTDDNCGNMLSTGQVKRARAAIKLFRNELTTSLGCTEPVANDAQLVDFNTTKGNHCNGLVISSATLKNMGTTPLTSVNIHYTIGDFFSNTKNWTGELAAGASQEVLLGLDFVFNSGLHELVAYTDEPNQTVDAYPIADTLRKMISIDGAISAPYTETFDMPYAANGWSIYDQCSCVPWQQLGEAIGSDGNTNSIMGVKHDFHDYFDEIGSIDELYSPTIDLSTIENPVLTFDVSYQYIASHADTLCVLVSDNCGDDNSFIPIFCSGGENLATRFTDTPLDGNDWADYSLDLSEFAGKQIMLNFKTISDGGTWIFIDNVNITGDVISTGETNLIGTNIAVYPNPTKDKVWVNLPSISKNSQATIYNISGQQVAKHALTTTKNQLDISTLSTGVYFITINSGTVTYKDKLVIL